MRCLDFSKLHGHAEENCYSHLDHSHTRSEGRRRTIRERRTARGRRRTTNTKKEKKKKNDDKNTGRGISGSEEDEEATVGRREGNVLYGRISRSIYSIRVKDIFVISPWVLGALTKMLGAPSNTPLLNMNRPLNNLMGRTNLYKNHTYPTLKGKLLMGNRPKLRL